MIEYFPKKHLCCFLLTWWKNLPQKKIQGLLKFQPFFFGEFFKVGILLSVDWDFLELN